MKNKGIPVYKLVFAWIIAAFAGIFPWITYLRIWKLTEKESDFFENYSGYVFDFFLYYKELFIVLIAFILVLVMVGENIFPDKVVTETPLRAKNSKKVFICFGIYTAAVLLSFFFSKNKSLALSGSPSEGEGIFVLIGYCVLFFGAMNYFCYEQTLKIFEKVMIFLCVVTVLLTAIEFFYEPVLKLPVVKELIAPEKYSIVVDNMNTDNYKSYVSLTFYNPNYFGGFCLLLIPFPLKKLLQAEDLKKTVVYILLTFGMFFSVTAAKSSASFYLALMELIFVFGLEGKKICSKWKKLAALFVISVAGFILLNLLSSGKLFTVGANAISNESRANKNGQIFCLEDIEIMGNELILRGKQSELVTICDGGKLAFYDGQGNNIDIECSEDSIIFLDERYQAVTVLYSENKIYYELGYDSYADFYVQDDCFYGIGQNGQLLTSVTLDKRFGEKIYSIFTGRGYAWVNTLPVLKDTIFIGYGAGNFSMYFPQNDYVGLLNTHGTHKLVIDKPHNAYLQTAVNTGVIGLASLLALFLYTVIHFVRYRGKCDNIFGTTADWTFVSVAAFAVYSVFNDSIVSVAPLFWILLGMQFSVMYIFEKA